MIQFIYNIALHGCELKCLKQLENCVSLRSNRKKQIADMTKLDIYRRIPNSLREITKQIAIGTFLIKRKKEANRIILYRILI